MKMLQRRDFLKGSVPGDRAEGIRERSLRGTDARLLARRLRGAQGDGELQPDGRGGGPCRGEGREGRIAGGKGLSGLFRLKGHSAAAECPERLLLLWVR